MKFDTVAYNLASRIPSHSHWFPYSTWAEKMVVRCQPPSYFSTLKYIIYTERIVVVVVAVIVVVSVIVVAVTVSPRAPLTTYLPLESRPFILL